MSLRKFISLLLLVSFVFTTVSPALATTTVNQNGVTLPILAEDDGTVSTQGANIDVVPLKLEIRADSGEITFGGDGGAITSSQGNQSFITDGNGKLFIATGGGNANRTDLDTPQRVAAFAPPAGTKFVRLASSSYDDATANGSTAYTGAVNGTALTRNITISTSASLPGSGTSNGAVILASIIDDNASVDLFGSANSALLPAGSLVLNFLSPVGGDQTTGNSIIINVDGVGLATDGAGTLGDSGNVSVKYIKPVGTNGAEALTGFTDGATTDGGSNEMAVATLGASNDKLEAIIVGTKTGNETAVAEPDSANFNTLRASKVTGTTVKVGPGEITGGGVSGKLDTDAIVIRAKERPDSTASTITYYQTPFETSKFVLATALANNGTDADTLQITSVADSNVFPNQDAVITVTFSLEDAAGATSTATLAVDAANVTLHGQRAFNGIRAAGATAGGQTTTLSTTIPTGFLGAAVNIENGSTAHTNYAAAVLYNGETSVANYDVADVSPLTNAILTNIYGATPATLYTATKTSTTVITGGTTALGIFPGSLIHNGSVATTGTSDLVNTANGTAGATANVHSASFATNNTATGSLIATPSGLTARLVNGTSGASIGNTAYFVLMGNDAGADMTAAGDRIAVSGTSPGDKPYHEGFTAQSIAEANDTEDNLIAAAELEANVLKIVPVINKYDGIRDALSIRPEATITLDDTSKTAGVKLIATISGNNIASSTRLVLAEISGGTVETEIDVTGPLPTHGVQANNDLMREKSDDPGQNRAAISIASVTGTSSSNDSIDDLIGTGNVLDDTAPPLFCGGTAGTSTRGPNGLVVQPKGRAILLTENGDLDFGEIEQQGSDVVIRVTLPSGWDLNNYNGSTAASEIVGIETSGGLSASVTRVQEITSAETTAFIDVGSIDSSTTTQEFNRMLGIFFRPHSLLVPSDTTDFNLTVTLVDNKATTASSDDETLNTMGTIALASECSTFLTVAFCPDQLSSFEDTSITTPADASVESTKVTRGARETSFASTVGPALRLVEGTPETITLPDLCITEGVADAIPLGSATSAGVTGVPTTFGDVGATNVTIHIATNFAGDSTDSAISNVGIANGAITAAQILTSDDSIDAETGVTTVSNNEVQFEVDTRVSTGNNFPFEETTRIRVPGLQLTAPGSAKTFSDQDLIVWVEVDDTSNEVTIGDSIAAGLSEVTASTNEYFLGAFSAGSTTGNKMRNLFSGKVKDTVTNAPTDVDWADNVVGGDNDATVVIAGGNPTTLTDATRSEIDSTTNFLELDGDTKISVLTSAINGVTAAVNALVSVAPGTLEPGSRVQVDGTIDDITVPVLADGSFQANIRCAAGTSINLTQTPDSAAVTTPALSSATCDDANVEPVLLSATFVDSGLGTLTGRGTVPVVFQVTASGKLDGSDFVPTADQLTLGGNSVTAVDGTTDQFIGILNFNQSSGAVVETTAGSGSSVTVSVDSDAPTRAGRPNLTRVRGKTNRKGNSLVVLRGTRLGNQGVAHFILNDGSSSPIDLRNRSSRDAQIGRRRSELGATIPSNAEYAVFHISGRGMSAIEL